MAVKWPLATGVWSNAANWNDGTKPTTGDTVHADSRTITIDENVDLGAGSKLTTETRSGGAAGGGFTFSGDYTITVADLVSNVTSACLTYTGSGTGAVVNANGTVAGVNNAVCIALNHTGSGTLTAVGVGFSNAAVARAFQNSGAGIFTITGNVSAVSTGYGAANNSTGTLNLTGVASVTSSGGGTGAGNLSTGTLNITGNPSATGTLATSSGALNNSTGALNVTTVGTLAGLTTTTAVGAPIRNAAAGALTITGSVEGSAVQLRPTVQNTSTGFVRITGTVTTGADNLGMYRGPALRNEAPATRAEIGTLGDLWAVEGGFYAASYPVSTTVTVELESTFGDTYTYYQPSAFPTAWSPLPADVRYDVDYQDGAKTGTCYVPPPESVALNVPVDDTVGTLEAGGGGGDPEEIAEAVWAYATRTLTAGVTLADNSITADAFDESTAFPLAAADTGATAVARTGADSDTLESLSDQLDGAALETTSQTLLINLGAIDTLVQDLPTSAEFEARTLEAEDYFDPATDAVANVTLVATTTDVTNLPSLDLTPVTQAIADLNDFDPLNDVVAHVSLVDVTTEVTIPAPVDLTPVIEAIGLLNDFDPAADVVANVALVDVTTSLATPPFIDLSGIPSAYDIADAVWDEAVGDHDQFGSTGLSLAAAGTAGDPWIAPLPGDYAEGTAGYLLGDLHERLEEQVEEGPAVVVPAPAAGQTTAWAMCYDEDGLPEQDVEIFIQCVSASGTASVFDGSKVTLTSDANGLAAGPIPRSASLTFTARRGARGKRVRFTGADADSLALPALVGAP
jgi:hypothetical protein